MRNKPSLNLLRRDGMILGDLLLKINFILKKKNKFFKLKMQISSYNQLIYSTEHSVAFCYLFAFLKKNNIFILPRLQTTQITVIQKS